MANKVVAYLINNPEVFERILESHREYLLQKEVPKSSNNKNYLILIIFPVLAVILYYHRKTIYSKLSKIYNYLKGFSGDLWE